MAADLQWARIAVTGLIFALLIWLRCPSILTRASFWAEDGWAWYPTCYVYGWHCLFLPVASYMQTVSTLVALVCQVLPLAAAPFAFAFVALIAQAASPTFLLSNRMAQAIPSVSIRLLLAVLIVAMPAMNEVYVNLTNTQWHLALLSFLILAASAPTGWAGRCFDTIMLMLSGLSGPFSVFLTPIAWIMVFTERSRWCLWRAVAITVPAIVQLSLILIDHNARTHGETTLGANLRDFNRSVFNNVGGAVLGVRTILRNGWGPGHGWLYGNSFAALIVGTLICALIFGLMAVAFVRGRPILRWFLLFVAPQFLAMLVDGITTPRMPLWREIASVLADRYTFFPTLACLAVVVAFAWDRRRCLRWGGRLLLAIILLFAVPGDWSLLPLPHTGFAERARAFAKAPPGTLMKFDIRPNSQMTLIKR